MLGFAAGALGVPPITRELRSGSRLRWQTGLQLSYVRTIRGGDETHDIDQLLYTGRGGSSGRSYSPRVGDRTGWSPTCGITWQAPPLVGADANITVQTSSHRR